VTENSQEPVDAGSAQRDGFDDPIPRRAWLALSVSTLVVFLVVIDISAVNVAFPSIREDFQVSDSELSWIIGAYNIVVGSLLMLSGRLADSIGRRKVYLPGVAVFGLGSMLCALSPSASWLIGARVVQAVGGSITLAAGFAVMLPEFPPSRRSTAIGVAGATGGLGAVVGPVVGSVLIDLFSWRGIFWLNVPLCILVLVIGPRLLSESSDPDATGRIDLVGVVIGTGAVAMMMFAIVQSESWGVADWRVLALFGIGLGLVPLLVHRSRVHPEPLINLELFQHQSFKSANIGVFLYGLGFTAGFLTNSLLLQDVWDMDIRAVGLVLAPSPLLSAAVSPVAGRWADRIGHRWILAAGCFSCSLGFLLFVLVLDAQKAIWAYVAISLLVGLGVGLSIATWSSAGISDIPPAKFGVAGATYNTLRQAAFGLGVSVVITLIAAGGAGTTINGIRSAYGWVAAMYLLAGLSVILTFPAGSARERSRSGCAGKLRTEA
jgi:EmrB/QacA subfamily drug resistance transporter